MTTAEAYIAHVEKHAHTVRRGFTRDGQPVRGFGISLDPSNPAMWIQNGYVWPQQAPPYNYVVAVHHCGITLAAFAAEVGLRAGVDWFDPAWTPSGAEGFRRAGRWHAEPQRGDWAFFNYGSGMIRHVGLVLNAEPGWVTCLEFNVDLSGQGRVLRRPAWMIVGYGRPNYAPPAPPTQPNPLPALLALTPREDDMALVIDVYDPETNANLFHLMSIGGVVSPTTGPYADEDNGFQRVRIAKPDWDAREAHQLRQLANLKAYFGGDGAAEA